MPAGPDVSVDVSMVSDPRYLRFVRMLAGEGAALAGFDEEHRDRIELAVVEGFTNVIRHAYGGARDRPVAIRLRAPAGTFRLEMDDHGTFVDPARIASRPLDQVRPGGLGVHLMKTTMDVVEYRRNAWGGTTLVLEKRLASASGEIR
ncbi:MAG TPA: ATP-binding protein [Planctomycetota bacterium]|jgi:anti-sigma regulatory factor (Ser/Thr protein kinase)|nr:ATP-binding protein [Planctomycetota bacterium]